jgi:hypothetical protein
MISVLPAQVEIQEIRGTNWISACAGRTEIIGFGSQ